MTVLGIETSCDETAVAVLDISPDDIVVRANVVSSQIKLHAQFGGVVPALAAREHSKNIGHVFETALKEADIKDFDKEVDLIAVTRGPGLAPALLVGVSFAKTLAMAHHKPLIGADHMRGHIYSNLFTNPKIEFPALNLIASGGHTELVLMRDYENFELVGETLDDAVGEAFDKAARLLGLGYPGGPAISKLAELGDPERFPLPSPMLNSKDFNFSYSGLKTALLYLLRDLGLLGEAGASSGEAASRARLEGGERSEVPSKLKADIAASFQNAALRVLVDKTIRAARNLKVKTILLSGGVSANKLLRDELAQAAHEDGFAYSQPEFKYTTDNAAMIALAGYFAYQAKPDSGDWQKLDIDANLGFQNR
ncbi:MAG TPA: tRNA (adenosine(37)-N6)-threonylcarbamoyltransferase complex transferase subunit TsaD [Candidatus Paceibacterota bacterium]|nr:tRNA (adenosine(37)-N6)-threonylcarbamoyltransferase complex transferase subunit TsaD [Candidatus Paceibacterota bacterium]